MAVSVYWAILAARWCLWVYARVMGDERGYLSLFHLWLGWPFSVVPGVREVSFLADLLAVVVSGGIALGIVGVLAGWAQARGGRSG